MNKLDMTPKGTRYAACTTIQYGYKPSSNTVTLTVEPLVTQATAATPDATVTQTPENATVTIPPAKTPEHTIHSRIVETTESITSNRQFNEHRQRSQRRQFAAKHTASTRIPPQK